MRRWLRTVFVGLSVLVVLAVGGVALYVLVLRDDPPDRVALSDDEPADAPATTGSASPDGEWQVQAGGSSFVGYRVSETFASLAAPSDAVGRTEAVEGTMTIAGPTVGAAAVQADLASLESDEDRRDSAIQDRGIETDRFPEARFTLTEPIDLGGAPEQNADVQATAVGDFTLHGVTRSVQIPLEARWSGDTIEVVGTLLIAFSDYEIEAPTVGGFVSVEDEGEMELQLTFERA